VALKTCFGKTVASSEAFVNQTLALNKTQALKENALVNMQSFNQAIV